MTTKLRILIAGDLFMQPLAFQEALQEQLADLDYNLEFRTVEFSYPIEGFPLVDYQLPPRLGGGWDDPTDYPESELEVSEINEYYGQIDDFVGQIKDEEILVVHMSPIPRAVLEQARNLKLIACCRGGPTNINLAAATELGIRVVNAPGRNAVAVAEFILGLLITQTRHITEGHVGLTQQGTWKIGLYRGENAGPEISGRTVGIIGLGNIGRALARLLSGFQVQLLAHDPYVDEDVFESLNVKRTPLEILYQASDFVLLAARLTEETRGMVGQEEMALMKPTAYLVNAARGGLLDYDALRQALEEKRIAGAALDVYDREPPLREEPLLRMPNVTVTPHIAGASLDVFRNAAKMLAADIRRFLRGEPLQNCLEPVDISAAPDQSCTHLSNVNRT
jgi:D-3-phosphoglycerate dehydrogenase